MMTAEKLLEAMGDIRPELIRDARRRPRKKPLGRRAAAILIAAVLALALAATALACSNGADWFRGLFTFRSGGELSAGQTQYIEENTVEIGQSAACGGWTVTLESAIGDKYSYYLKLLVEAPEGTVLDGFSYYFGDASLSPADPAVQYSGDTISSQGGWTILRADDDGRSNTVALLFDHSISVTTDSDLSYADGAERIFRLEDFCVCQDDGQETILAEGVWSFRFTFAGTEDGQTDAIDFSTGGAVCPGIRMMGDTVDVQLIFFRLTAMGAYCEYTFFDGDTPEALDFSGVQVVMKDGASVALLPQSGGLDAETEIGDTSFTLLAPLSLDEVDYVVFPNDVILWPAEE